MSTLWMGNLDAYMDEKFITRAFSTMGEQAVSVRIIRSKVPGAPPSSSALGYCFVEMADEATAERCLRKINGKSLPGASPPTRFKLNRATFGKQETGLRNRPMQPETKAWPTGTGYTPPYDQYSQYQQQAYPNYYSSWGYDQTAATYGYTYPQYDYSQYAQSQEIDLQDDGLEDPSAELDVVETNKRFFQNSEELYDALIDCQWKSAEFSAEQDELMLTIPDPLS
ncbi:tRNA selenocysteine 1-associated protein 1-like isoform X4 [Syngnathus typhle]|uniref:tRNA selenocysteine 1-associated protein 1-like isoform X4 n=1 Tax=Syngnathus typhle TaxID=161592 RepID=UPI002A6AABBF|nr:tRNA selenocysteine 1-associated protein 1-like isoform X4 [Syngnathus typhle]